MFFCLLVTTPSVGQEHGPLVSFSFSFPGSQPDRYLIAVNSDGHTTYESSGRFDENADAESFNLELTLSAATASHIFDLAKRANYFQGEVDSRKKHLASTGVKILSYKDGERSSSASYNYSQSQPIQSLTKIFQNLSTTLEFGRRLEFYRRYQKLALDEELKRMEQMSKQNSLEELTALAPILRQIAGDTTIINPVRARAERLLEHSQGQGQ
jgi:hypothetical protein